MLYIYIYFSQDNPGSLLKQPPSTLTDPLILCLSLFSNPLDKLSAKEGKRRTGRREGESKGSCSACVCVCYNKGGGGTGECREKTGGRPWDAWDGMGMYSDPAAPANCKRNLFLQPLPPPRCPDGFLFFLVLVRSSREGERELGTPSFRGY